jgi:exopolysaccharide biosynthesis polyprenyl glycosylphosphotransferase
MRRRFTLSVFFADLVALIVALAATSWWVFDTPLWWRAPLVGEAEGSSVWPFVTLMVAGAAFGSWISLRSWANGIPRPTYGRALAIVGFAVAFTALGVIVTRAYWSRPLFGGVSAVWLAGALAHRVVRRRRPWTETMVLVTGEKGLAEDIRNTEHADVIDVLDPIHDAPQDPIPEGSTLVLDLRAVLSESMATFVSSSNLAGYPIRALTSVYEEHTGRIPMIHLVEGWELAAPVSRNQYAPFKQLFDYALTILFAPLWIPLGALIWSVVKLDSRGPAIYRQERVGLGGKTFTLYKFRTMAVDAEAEGPRFAAVQDERLTRVGRWLRKVRLDELPQLWNVLRGDLSLVGPRPERPVFVDDYLGTLPFYGSRHLIRPGVTGWAQVNYGYADDAVDTFEKLTYDLYYVKNMSVWLDLQILGKSVWTVLSGFGAR